ncbi:MAG: HIT domain-containing protein [Dehalococcoidia bacterium]|nr:HIT domain-containing protein [Dehalococcoidia bacterium]
MHPVNLFSPSSFCVFCEIVAGRSPAEILHEDERVVVFRNRLRWVPVMLLAVPRVHMAQSELWSNLGRAGAVAYEMGMKHSPEGFRLVSNFGPDAMQSQPHAHVHILSQPFLDHFEAAQNELFYEDENVVIHRYPHSWVTLALHAAPRRKVDLAAFWGDLGPIGRKLVDLGWENSRGGFRLLSHFAPTPEKEDIEPHVHLLGGTFLGEYA